MADYREKKEAMQVVGRLEQFLRKGVSYTASVLGLCAGMLMLMASVSTWLKESLGANLSAWKIAVYVGWPLRLGAFNYGLLCLVGALLAFVVGGASVPFLFTKLSFVKRRLKKFYRLTGIYCLIIPLLFCLQYLVLDTQSINQLAQDQVQSLLITRHLGYHLLPSIIPINPFNIDSNVFTIRLTLLVNQLSFGILMPVVAGLVLLSVSRQVVVIEAPADTSSRSIGRWVRVSLFILIALCLFGRVPIALFCESMASTALQNGDYATASSWLNGAITFDPSLNEVASYHVQRGQIDYFVFHDTQGEDSRAYMGFTAYQEHNYPQAYQDLLVIWKLHPTTQWITAEFDAVMMRSIESKRPLQLDIASSNVQTALQEDDLSLSYVHELLQVDPSNIYGHYVLGRIECEFQSHLECSNEMLKVITLCHDKDIQSSAYTYLGLSEAGQGNYIASRMLLMEAVKLDSNYCNNKAREELSGLH